MTGGDARIDRLIEALQEARPASLHVVALPDFFLDHIVACPPWTDATEAMRAIHDRGGGNLHGWPQRLQPGGNAANSALALARLGVRAHLVARTDAFGLAYLRETVAPHGVDLTQVRGDGDLAVTTALEFGPEKRNVMLSYPGSVANFSFEDLDDNQRTLVEGSDAVLVTNWTANRGAGTSLVEGAIALAKRGRALTYLDTGDPSGRPQDVEELVRRVLSSGDLDVLALNENEMRLYGGTHDLDEAAARVRKIVRGTLDLHTAERAVSWGPGGRAASSCFRVPLRRATGAGDAWNAGNILGYLLGLDAEDRLTLANAVAALYVSSADGLHPRVADVVSFLRARPELRAA